jgi:hypothetical protein
VVLRIENLPVGPDHVSPCALKPSHEQGQGALRSPDAAGIPEI